MLPPRARANLKPLQRVIYCILGPKSPQTPTLPNVSFKATITAGNKSHSALIDRLIWHWSIPRALFPFLILWITANILLIRQQYYLSSAPMIIDCTASIWDDWPPDTCGINGTACADDLTSLEGTTLRCMSGCRDTTLGNPRWVGDEKIDGEPLIIGGGDLDQTFRADSWICASAILTSQISASFGGCVIIHPLSYPSSFAPFLSTSSNSLTSLGFSPSFPGAFRMVKASQNGCIDLHYIMTAFNAVCLAFFTLFCRPSPALLYTILLVLGFWQITLFSDAPSYPPDWETSIGRFFPSLFVGYWIYRQSFSITLPAFSALPFELTLWQGAGYWIGVESSAVFAKFPISRLGYDSLDPGGIIALCWIIIVVLIVVAIQWMGFRKTAMVRYYLFRYIPLIPLIIILVNIPNYTFRPHHYILALLAIPVLSLPNRVSLFWQAFMLGLFLDGVARWGYASILEETSSLLGDASSETYLPSFLPNSSTSTIISWSPIGELEAAENVTGYSVLINDIQMFSNDVGTSLNLSQLGINTEQDNYFRLAYIESGTSLDFSDPLTRWANGSYNWT